MNVSIELIVEELFLEAGLQDKSISKVLKEYKSVHRQKTKPWSCDCCGAEHTLICIDCGKYIRTPKFISYLRTDVNDKHYVCVHEYCLDRAVTRAEKKGVAIQWGTLPLVKLVIEGPLTRETAVAMREPDSSAYFIKNDKKEIVGVEFDIHPDNAKRIAHLLYKRVLREAEFIGSAYVKDGDKKTVLWRTE